MGLKHTWVLVLHFTVISLFSIVFRQTSVVLLSILPMHGQLDGQTYRH